jgi:CrcB protein
MIKYALLALGGAIGTVLRFVVSTSTYQFFNTAIFPWGTLVVNLAGSFIIGMLAGFNETGIFSLNLRMFLFVGILGGFTTFSAFSLETLNLMRTGEIRYAIINVAASNIFGIALAFGGFYIGRYLFVRS